MAKATARAKDTVVRLNQTKEKRALDIHALVVGKPVSSHIKSEYSAEGRAELKDKFTAILDEAGIDPKKDEDGAVAHIYRKLGGGTMTYEKQAKIKAVAKKNRAKMLKKEEGEEDDEKDADEKDEGKKDDKETDEE